MSYFSFLFMTCFILVLIGLVYQLNKNEEIKPIIKLNDFIKHKHAEIEHLDNIQDIKELKVDGMDHFSAVTCFISDSLSEARIILKENLKTIPQEISDHIIESTLISKTNIFNIIQNSTKPIQSTGKAIAYLGWWNTHFTEPSTYETCVLISGISLTATEIIAGYIEEKKSELIGYQPCHCGFFSCEKCPIIQEKIYSSPIYKRHALSIQDHQKLHQYMIQDAILKAELLLSKKTFHILPSQHKKEQKDPWEVKTKNLHYEGDL